MLQLAADTSHDLCSDADLRRVYSTGPGETSLAKVADHVHALYRPYIEAAPFAGARAIKRSGLWDGASQVALGTLPSPGAILQALSKTGIDGVDYDTKLQARQQSTLY